MQDSANVLRCIADEIETGNGADVAAREGATDLDLYFTLARGDSDHQPLEIDESMWRFGTQLNSIISMINRAVPYYLAGLAVGFWQDEAELAALWQAERRFAPNMPETRRAALFIPS